MKTIVKQYLQKWYYKNVEPFSPIVLCYKPLPMKYPSFYT